MASYPVWQFVLTDLTGRAIGEVLDAPQRQVIRGLSSPSTASFTVLATNPLLSYLLTSDLNLKCYRNDGLMFHGPITTIQLAADDPTATPTLSCSAADPSWRFEKRLSGKSNAGRVIPTSTDRLTAAETLIGDANTDGETGVKTLGQTCGTPLSGAYVAGPFKKLSECIADLGNTLGGFDWRVDPLEYTAGKIGEFRAAAVLGQTKANATFEYQGRGNMRAPNFVRGIETLVNNVYSIPDDGPVSTLGIRSKNDSGSISTRGLYEEVVDTSNILNQGLRDAVLDDHILYRKNPRQLLQFQPDVSDGTGRVPEYGVDYQVADLVHARVVYNRATLVDGYVRLYKMQFDVDENSRETLTPTVVNEA
jgi:hypothetical protein